MLWSVRGKHAKLQRVAHDEIGYQGNRVVELLGA